MAETWIIKTEGAEGAAMVLYSLFNNAQITNFTSNSVHYNTTSIVLIGFGPFRSYSYRYDDTEVATSPINFPSVATLDIFKWNDESYRTIILDTPASGSLLENLLLCADKQGGGGGTMDVTYNGTKIIDSLEVTPPVAVTYNGSTIATLNAGDTKTLQCNGKVMSSNVVIGEKTLQCNGKLMASDVVVEVGG